MTPWTRILHEQGENFPFHQHIIPHIWKLANSPHSKTNKDIDKGSSCRPISLLSVNADTGEEHSSLHNRKHTKHTHATRVQNTTLYSDGTTHSEQHRNKGIVFFLSIYHNKIFQLKKGFNQMAPHVRTITVALDMSKAFDTINIHTYQEPATDQHSRHNH